VWLLKQRVFGLLRRVVGQHLPEVSKKRTALSWRLRVNSRIHNPEDNCRMFLRNVGKHWPNRDVKQPRIPASWVRKVGLQLIKSLSIVSFPADKENLTAELAAVLSPHLPPPPVTQTRRFAVLLVRRFTDISTDAVHSTPHFHISHARTGYLQAARLPVNTSLPYTFS
jgi:hypothetical protein